MLETLAHSFTSLIAGLDQLPNDARGLLAAIWLALLLGVYEWRRERRQEARDFRWRIAHEKAALLALLFAPLAVAAFPETRLPVFVETLPSRGPSLELVLHTLVAIWLLIALIIAAVRWREQQAADAGVTLAAAEAISAPSAAVAANVNPQGRVQHWSAQLGLDPERVELRFVRIARPALSHQKARGLLALPAAAAHWPAAVVDVAMIRQLCELKLRHRHWLRFAVLVGSLYWPFPWILRGICARLSRDFDVEAWALAEACYRDRLSFQRARRQLEDRLHTPAAAAATGPGAVDATAVEPAHGEPGDPYGRVFATFAQLLFAVYLLSGLTLKQLPDDSNFPYAEFVHDWYEQIHRAPEYRVDAGPDGGADAASDAESAAGGP